MERREGGCTVVRWAGRTAATLIVLALLAIALIGSPAPVKATHIPQAEKPEERAYFLPRISRAMQTALSETRAEKFRRGWKSPAAKEKDLYDHTCARIETENSLHRELRHKEIYHFTWNEVGVDEKEYMGALQKFAEDARLHLKEVLGRPRTERARDDVQCDLGEASFPFGDALFIVQQFVWTWGGAERKNEILPTALEDIKRNVVELREAVNRGSVTQTETNACLNYLTSSAAHDLGIPDIENVLGLNADEQAGVKLERQSEWSGCYYVVLLKHQMPPYPLPPAPRKREAN
ncbi:MAG: hypothetical protein Q8R13_01995 [bacterium]|nr:hypothetical protein [bacterium]MDZ4295956.1 hypothetical protein [Patescibacteria group bacterium]